MHKLGLILLSTTLITTTAMAGGHIFGSKHKSSNPYGVYAINVHVCSDLECPPVRIVEGNCNGTNMSKQWGVCVCDKGYVASGEHCDPCPAGQVSDGINGCQTCPEKTYRASENATECTPCPDVNATACADITGASTACVDGYEPKDDVCVEISTGPTCPGNSSATEITNGTSFEVTEGTESITCWCPEGQSYQSTGCADGSGSDSNPNIPTVTCEESEKVTKTYGTGGCCTDITTGLFCPDETPPKCTPTDDDSVCCDMTASYGVYLSKQKGYCCMHQSQSPECCEALSTDENYMEYDYKAGYCRELNNLAIEEDVCKYFGYQWVRRSEWDVGECCFGTFSVDCCYYLGYEDEIYEDSEGNYACSKYLAPPALYNPQF